MKTVLNQGNILLKCLNLSFDVVAVNQNLLPKLVQRQSVEFGLL